MNIDIDIDSDIDSDIDIDSDSDSDSDSDTNIDIDSDISDGDISDGNIALHRPFRSTAWQRNKYDSSTVERIELVVEPPYRIVSSLQYSTV